MDVVRMVMMKAKKRTTGICLRRVIVRDRRGLVRNGVFKGEKDGG